MGRGRPARKFACATGSLPLAARANAAKNSVPSARLRHQKRTVPNPHESSLDASNFSSFTPH